MFVTKCLFSVVILCIVHETLSKPTESALTQGRGIGSTIWGWITYPFSGWWSSSVSEPTPITDQLIASTTYGPNDSIELGKHNVTVWCNEQTCTTMKCNKDGCKNNTCNMYDTYLDGECREYNTVVDPDKPMSPLELTTTSNPPQSYDPIVITTKMNEESTKTQASTKPNIQEVKHPLERKETINDHSKATTEKIASSSKAYNKVTEIPTFVGISVREKASTIDPEDQSATTSP